MLTEKISGVNVAVINTPYIEKTGTKGGLVDEADVAPPQTQTLRPHVLFAHQFMETEAIESYGQSYKDFFQAGQSVEGIDTVASAADVVRTYHEAVRTA